MFVALRSDNGYIGMAKQSALGTAVAPSQFYRWLDGSGITIDAKMEDVWEGDGTRHLSQVIKNRQSATVKLITNVRPNDGPYLDAAAQGTGSDAYTAPAVSTTLSGATVAGAASITVASNAGLSGTGTIALDIEAGGTNDETATYNVPATGAGPYTLTVNNGYNGGNGLKLSHTSGNTVQSAATHVITDQPDGAFFSVEVSIGGTSGIIIRLRDCKVEEIKRSGKAGTLVTYEVTFVGIACLVQAAAATVTFDPHQPYLFQQGTWTLDGSTTGDALAVESFDIDQKNNLDKDIQTEQLILASIIYGMLNMDVGLSLVMQSGSRIANTYFGGPTGTTDSQTVFAGSVTLIFALPDGLNTLQYAITTLQYTKTEPPSLKKDGKAFRTPVSATSVSNMSVNPYLLQVTAQNTIYAAY